MRVNVRIVSRCPVGARVHVFVGSGPVDRASLSPAAPPSRRLRLPLAGCASLSPAAPPSRRLRTFVAKLTLFVNLACNLVSLIFISSLKNGGISTFVLCMVVMCLGNCMRNCGHGASGVGGNRRWREARGVTSADRWG